SRRSAAARGERKQQDRCESAASCFGPIARTLCELCVHCEEDRIRGMAIKDGLLAEYDHEMGTTRKLLERLPDDRFSWKPHEKSMTLGGLSTHLANLPYWGDLILNRPLFDIAEAPPNLQPKESRAEGLACFDE